MTIMHIFCFMILANFYCFNVLAADKRGTSALFSSEEPESKKPRKLKKSYSSSSDTDENSSDAAWNAEEDPDFGEDEFHFEQPKITQTVHDAPKILNENFAEIIDRLGIAGLTRHEIQYIKNALLKEKRLNLVESEQLKNIVNILLQPSTIRGQTPRHAIIRYFTESLQIHIPQEKALSDDEAMATKTPKTLDQSSDEASTNKDIEEEGTSLIILQNYLRSQKIDESLLQKTMEYCAQFSPQKITDIMSIP